MSHCDPFYDLIQSALDQPLDPGDRARLDAHLAACDACRAYEADMAALDRRLQVPSVAPEALMPRLGLTDPPAPRRRVPAWALGAAAAFVAAFGLGLWQLSPGSAPTPVASLTAEVPAESVLTWLEPETPSEIVLPSDALFGESP